MLLAALEPFSLVQTTAIKHKFESENLQFWQDGNLHNFSTRATTNSCALCQKTNEFSTNRHKTKRGHYNKYSGEGRETKATEATQFS